MRGGSFSHLAKLAQHTAPLHNRERAQFGVVFEEFRGAQRRDVRGSRGSIDEIVPTHAAAAPAINFALRSS